MEPDALSTMDGKLKSNTRKMDEYDKKFAEMQKYIPFLEAMIERLQNVKDKSREIQLQKMQSLHGILSNSKRKLKIETLQRCEDVLQKLHNKVEKGNAPGLHVPNKKGGDSSSQSVASPCDSENRNRKTRDSSQIDVVTIPSIVEETPASPSPPVSPETIPQTAPIIIPTERSVDPILEISDKHVNSDEVDILHSIKPIVIPTERTCDINRQSPSFKTTTREDTDDLTCSEWDMLEESEVQSTKGRSCWKSTASCSDDVSNVVKLLGNNLPQKISDASTPTKSRHIATVPVPSLGGSRRLSSVLEKNILTGLHLDTINSRAESPPNVSEVRLSSPDPEILFPKSKNVSPRAKDGFPTPKGNSKSTMPLLVSPPPVSTEPPLSIEDLAELLNEEGDAKHDKKDNQLQDNTELKRSGSGKSEDTTKKDNGKKACSNIDVSTSKQLLLSQDDIDRESDRRWEEVDKHIVKLTTRKCLPNVVSTTSNTKSETSKPNEIKSPLVNQHSFPLNAEKSIDHRHRSSSPSFRAESRYAENYERHPRQLRDNMNDKLLNVHSRLHDEEIGNMHGPHGGPVMQDDRNAMLYQRRSQTANVGDVPRIDHPGQQEHFNRQSVNPPLWPPSHPSSSTNDFCNPQWVPPNNYSGMGGNSMQGMPMPNPMYQHSMGMHQDTWNPGVSNSAPMDSHPMNDSPIRPNHFNANVMPGIRPLLSSPHSRPQEISHDDSLPMNASIIPPLLSPTNYPVASQYRGFHDAPFDRPVDYPIARQSWDQSMNRPNDAPYRNDPELSCNKLNVEGMIGMPNSYPRPSTPCPWTRDRDRCNRGRGRDGYYNDRCRGEARNSFNRDSRSRIERLRDVHNDWDNGNRFNRDNRIAVSDRDPRLRTEHGISGVNTSHNRESNSNSVRDPRLTKDKHSNANKFKDNAYQERDPRKRAMSSSLIQISPSRKAKQKSKSKKSESQKRDSESSSTKQVNEKSPKDKMQSPLESLYGVIDTKGKSSQSYGLQKFKIPKIKRAEQLTQSNSPNEEKKVDNNKCSSEKDDTTAEVTSSSDIPHLEESWDLDDTTSEMMASKKEVSVTIEPTNVDRDISSPTTSSVNKDELKFTEPDSIMNTSITSLENIDSMRKDDTDIDGLKLKDGLTQEWIEGLIRKSLEFGEGKKLFEQAKLIQKLGEALEAKKLKKIKKIIESESESSSSDKDENIESKKVQFKRKRRVIVPSDSSDEDSLAERLGILTNLTNEKKESDEIGKDDSTCIENSVISEETKKHISSHSSESVNTDHDANTNNAEKCTNLEKPEKLEPLELKDDEIKDSEINDNKEKIETKQHDIEEIQDHKELDASEQHAIIDDSSTGIELNEVKDSGCSKTPKPKTKRRNSLEMLQEDIREMFISEGVVTATGHRMCRVLKESQTGVITIPSTSTPNPTSKKAESSKSLDKQNVETDGEEQMSNTSKSKKTAKIRNSEKSSNKIKSKSKKEVLRVTRQRLKELNFSSDSEEDQPLSLRTTNRDLSSSRNSDVIKVDEEKDHDAEVLRRSKRVLRKDTTKEQGVGEKTNVLKMDSSKTMFDSSSDESFGIDVTELAAAVDISLNTEKQSSRSLPRVSSPKDKSNIQNISKKKSKRKRSSVLPADKIDDTITSFTDKESVISDNSMLSSTPSEKKINNNIDKPNNSEELLSDILVGLIPSKTSNSQGNKMSDADVDADADADADDNTNDSVRIEQCQKKVSGNKELPAVMPKKKKKKCNWQMGILSKKKRKKAATSIQTEPDCAALEIQDTLEKINIQKDEDKHIIVEEQESSIKSISEHNDTNDKVATNEESDTLAITDTNITNVSVSSPLDNTTSKTENENIISTTDDNKTSTNKNVSLTSKKGQPQKETQLNLDINQLIEYAWTGQERYKCLLCYFRGKNIVHHYKLNHPGKEILISRLKLKEAQDAIEEAKQNNYEKTCNKFSEKKSYSFNCRICYFSTEGLKDAAMEAFYEHCTTHTGEYRFQCNNCSYQAVTATSMRVHYYTVCLKSCNTFNEAITEDKVPTENSIYGYLCSKCNYVQLKRSNLQAHMEIWHQNVADSKIIKINMSTKVVDVISSTVTENKEVNLQSSLKVQECETSSKSIEQQINDKEKNDAHNVSKDGANAEIKETQYISKEKDQRGSNNQEPECTSNKHKLKTASKCEDLLAPDKGSEITISTTVSDKLSVFVCPPELEHKEVEIQLERKKKMQEIVENFGIKVHKDISEKGKSIIDTLKDKMKTNLHKENEPVKDLISTTSSSELCVSNDPVSSTTTMSSQNNLTMPDSYISNDRDRLTKENTLISSKLGQVKDQNKNAIQNDASLGPEGVSVQGLLTPENINSKVIESEIETSDNETTRESATVYDSDSSSEQSDSEITTDVNKILKETSSIATSSKDPMMTTIQRLAAQLQNTKSLDECGSDNLGKRQTQKISISAPIPKPPNVIPISSIKHLLGKQDKRIQETKNKTKDYVNEPKNFIRLRRLSGDMLSMPSENQEDTLLLSGTGSQADTSGDILQTDTEEECSFLKIENVVSLAPCNDNAESESTIISDIRKAVETSPVKYKGVSLLKKTAPPLILKRINSATLRQPIAKTNTSQESVQLIPVQSLTSASSIASNTSHTTNYVPIVPKSKIIHIEHNKLPFQVSVNKNTTISPVSTHNIAGTGSASLSNVNYKILKVIKTSPILKTKDFASQSAVMKLKSSDAYTAMLKPTKLSQLYKCMGRDCSFTTDSINLFYTHYNQHNISFNKKKDSSLNDYQKCAYCYMVLNDWILMKQHIEEKHAHCRYQCNNCFYRAIAPSYVQIHQAISHPGNHVGILLGKLIKELPTKEEYNRHDYIQPFVCQHECGKIFYIPETFISHLTTKHATNLSVYKCHLCTTSCLKIDQLIVHYKMHGIYKYQCLYCLNGADSFIDMLTHLSVFHCTRLPQILERSLPAQISRNKDVIDQLMIRTLDIKTPTEVMGVKNEIDKQEKDLQSLSSISSVSPEEISILDEKTNDVSDTKVINSVSKSTINEGSSTSIFKKISNAHKNNSTETIHDSNNDINISQSEDKTSELFTLSRSCASNVNQLDKSSVPKTTIAPEKSHGHEENYHTSKHILHEPELQLLIGVDGDANAIDPLGLSGTLDCSDEFINVNLLDNPNFLKSSHDNSSSPVSKKSMINESKTDDSDIEILEHIETCKDKNENKEEKISKKSDRQVKNTLDTKSIENNPKKQQSDTAHSTGPSNSSKDINANSSKTRDKSDKPLTLDDIKDTGFTGNKLYKCGYDGCNYSASTSIILRMHLKQCTLGGVDKNLNCIHCGKRFVKIGFLLEHLKLHGLKRFGCSLCKARCTVSYQAMAHMKTKHKFPYSKVLPADPENPSADGLFIVQPILPSGERRGKKRKMVKVLEKDSEKTNDIEKLCFGPDEIESLPRQAIYNREVQCAVCPYTTKVRTNIIRHLQLHAKDETVPEIGPVNPVPCLDKKERMFDKMVNLASSSHQNGRMGGKPKDSPKDNDESFIPKFVPEHKRYVCSVAECNYLTVDEAMLRYHLKALHSDEQYFRCPHCPQPPLGQEAQNIAIDKMGVHLKMHDTRLYKCSHCNHHHYHRHIIERHLSDKHPEKRPFVKVIRELENTENIQQTTQDEIEEEIPDPDGNHWKCNICEYKCVYKAEMITHVSVSHDEKSQFKCTACSFKTSGKVLFEQHITSKHPNDSNADYVMVYQRIKGVNKRFGDSAEQGGQDEPFDTTPLWRRDMPRIRHIRGILLEDEEDTLGSTETSSKIGKRKSDTDLVSTKPAKIKHGKSISLDENKHSKEKSKRSLSCEKISTEMSNSDEILSNTNNTLDSKSLKVNSSMELNDDFNDSDVGRFGPYGKPVGNMYLCTLCDQYKTKYKHDMRDHLYRELNYSRWHCKDCGFSSVNRNALLKHFTRHHNGERPNHVPLSPDNAIEKWVGTLLKRQTDIMRGLSLKQDNKDNTILQSNTKEAMLSESTKNKTSITKTDHSITNKVSGIVEHVGSKKKIYHNVIKVTSKNRDIDIYNSDNIDDDNDDDDEDDNDNSKNLIIAIKDDDEMHQEKDAQADESKDSLKNDTDKPLVCKHCKMKFARWRGLKLHVQISHLKRLGFLCPYCDRSTNSEALMRQHIRSKHPGCIEKIVNNPAAGGPELDDEFWKKEYGIVSPKKDSRKRKRKASDAFTKDKTDRMLHEVQEKCNQCGFTAMSYAGLKVHMRVHAPKDVFKCEHCTFNSSIIAELREHWEFSHPQIPFNIKTTSTQDMESTSSNTKEHKYQKNSEDHNVKEECWTNDHKSKEKLKYSCYYCKVQSSSLDALQKHWSLSHQATTSGESAEMKVDLPFRYKEISKFVSHVNNAQDSEERKINMSSNITLENMNKSNFRQGWACQWCHELCYSENAMKAHQNMFHSHLHFHFKKEDGEEVCKEYVCPICSFVTVFINDMKKHVSKHTNLFKCKHCDKTFINSSQVEIHNNKEHPKLEVKIESVTNDKQLLETIMTKVMGCDINQKVIEEKTKQGKSLLNTKLKVRAVARKSTAMSTIRVRNIAYKVRAVARKSTHPLSHYPSTSFCPSKYKHEDNHNTNKYKQFSFYGIPSSPVNLGQLSTYMVVGGHRMKVNCTTLAQLININPQIKLKDIKYDVKYISDFSTIEK